MSPSTIRSGVCGLVAAASAVLSADATHAEVLHQRAILNPTLAWLAVGVFEGGALYLGLVTQERSLAGKRAGWHRAGFGLLLAVAVVVNVLHAWTNGARSFGLVIGGLLPLVLIAMLESAWHERAEALQAEAEHAAAEKARAAEEAARAEAERARTDVARVRAERATSRAAQRAHVSTRSVRAQEDARVDGSAQPVRTPVPREEREALIRRLLAENPDVTPSKVAEALGVHRSNGSRELQRVRRLVAAEQALQEDDEGAA